jgi:5,10-methylenetetrahydromethanopterin reductase
MSRLAFGVELHEYLDARTVLEEIQLVEALGYDSVWLGDSQLIWRELYALMGAGAVSTSRVALGTGVTNPITRLPAVTASAITTIQELSGGRAILGVGVGDSSMATMGLQPVTRAHLSRFVATVRALCNGESAPSPAGGEMRLTFGASEKCPPIVVGASGPKMLRLAGQIGDGVIVVRQAQAGERLQAMLDCVRAGRAESERPDRPFVVCLSAAAAVHGDRRKALAAVRPHVARGLFTPTWSLSEAAQRASEAVKTSYDFYEHMSPTAKHAALIPDEVVTEFAIAGTPADCVAQVQALFEAGADEITIRPYGIDGGSRGATIETFAKEVMAPVLARLGSPPRAGLLTR